MFLGLDKDTAIAFLVKAQPFYLWYFGLLNLWNTILAVLGSIKVYKRNIELKKEDISFIQQSNTLPWISIIIPCYNNQEHIVESINNILNLSYPYKKIIVVNDGSIDASVKNIVEKFNMIEIPKFYDEQIATEKVKTVFRAQKDEQIYLLDKDHGKKFDTLNAGVNAVETDFFIVLDSDTFIEDSGFEALIRPLLSSPDVVSVGSSIRIKNGCSIEYNRVNTKNCPQSYLTSLQSIEYFRSFLIRLGWDFFNCNFCIAGAFSLFPKKIIIKAGGFADSIGEDIEIIIRLHRIMRNDGTPYRIFYIPDVVAWTLVPDKVKLLSKQRTNWHLAVLESLYFHKRMFFNIRYGIVGLFVYPYWFFCEAIEPLIEISGYIYILIFFLLGELEISFLIFYLVLSLGLIFNYSFFSIITEYLGFRKYPSFKSVYLLFTSCIFENLGYHQMTLWWRTKAFFKFFSTFKRIRKESLNIRFKIAKAKNL
jgi:cellulose synthase/poly-beta-1,6-N-acetylglucosamine synthase-like glycosyltransferase